MKKLTAMITAALLLTMSACSGNSTQIPNEPTVSESETTKTEPAPTDENGNILIRIATDDLEWLPPELETAIEEFNEMDNGYHVKPVIYSLGSDDSGGLQTADMRLQMDILQGKNVDIVMDYSFSEMSRYDILSEKGAFVDLYTFLDGESGISRSELNSHILGLHENDGKLYQMPLYFNVDTMCGDAEYVGTTENWTLNELMAHWEKMPEGAFFCNNSTKWPVYWAIVRGNLGAFVDYENGTCSFDSPEFVKLLEFCNSFPDTKVKVQPDWDTIHFLNWCSFSGFDEFHKAADDTTVFVGYPSENRKGSFIDTLWKRYSICATAHPAVQEGAWEFLSYMLDADVQIKNCISYNSENYKQNPHLDEDGFPINQTAFEKVAQGMIAHAGESRVLSFSGREKDVGYLTQEEYERLLKLIGSLNRMNSPVDKTANTIIENEVEAYFAGERTAEEVAKSIQGRMEIMISERS